MEPEPDFIELSFGFVPVRLTSTGFDCLVVKTRSTGFRSFPKGHLESNEASVQAAIRELYEETGYVPTLFWTGESWSTDSNLAVQVTSLNYTYRKRSGIQANKTVRLYLAQVERKTDIQDTKEIEALEWHPATLATADIFSVELKRKEYINQVLPILQSQEQRLLISKSQN